MAIYLLGIVRARDVARSETGHNHGQVRWVLGEELAGAVVGPQPSPPELAEHARTLAAIHRHAALLPVQFGAALPDEAAVRTLLQSRREELASVLDRVEGACEMGLRIALGHLQGPHFQTSSPLPPTGEGPGVRAPGNSACACASGPLSPGEYLASRRNHYAQRDRLGRQAESAAAGYVEPLRGLWRDWRHLAPAPPGIVRLAFLIEWGRLAEFYSRLEVLRQARQAERCTSLGPWPPYSFV